MTTIKEDEDLEQVGHVPWFVERRDYETPFWKSLRAAKRLEQNMTCENCGKQHSLAVHHNRYRMFYDCTLADLMLLCDACHMRVHWFYGMIYRKGTLMDMTRGRALELLRMPHPKKAALAVLRAAAVKELEERP